MKVTIEYVEQLVKEVRGLNKLDLRDIVFFEDGKKLDIPSEVLASFEFTGLNNIDFVSSGFYKLKK